MLYAMKAIMAHFDKAGAKPKVKAVKADPERDEPPRCYTCLGEEDDERGTCPTCHGTHYFKHEELSSVLLTVYRDFYEVPVQCSIRDGEVIDAWSVATIGEPGEIPRWFNGTGLDLTFEEQQEALDALRADKSRKN